MIRDMKPSRRWEIVILINSIFDVCFCQVKTSWKGSFLHKGNVDMQVLLNINFSNSNHERGCQRDSGCSVLPFVQHSSGTGKPKVNIIIIILIFS